MPEDIKCALTPGAGGVYISLHVQPGARKEGVTGLFGTSLKVALKAPPVDGKANSALLRFLAGALGVPQAGLELCSGASSRDKKVFVAGLTLERTEELLKLK